jgi:hypothetical protein
LENLKKVRKSFARGALTVLKEHWVERGWRKDKLKDGSLIMRRQLDCQVEQSILISQPMPPGLLPSEESLGFSCTGQVFFGAQEDLIHEVMGQDPKLYGRLTASFPLGSLVRKDTYHCDNVYLADIRTEPQSAMQPFLRDYERYLLPVLDRLSDVDVLADESYLPPIVRPWIWNLRRAVYFHQRGERAVATKYLDRIEEEAEEALRGFGAKNDEERSRIFTNIASVGKNSNRRSAEQALKTARALRTVIKDYMQ